VRRLIQANADVNDCDNHGYTALLLAAKLGRDEILHQLRLAGSTLYARTYNNETAIQLAQQGHHHDVVTYLRSAGGVTEHWI
jgi:ankyrin repeat protein